MRQAWWVYALLSCLQGGAVASASSIVRPVSDRTEASRHLACSHPAEMQPRKSTDVAKKAQPAYLSSWDPAQLGTEYESAPGQFGAVRGLRQAPDSTAPEPMPGPDSMAPQPMPEHSSEDTSAPRQPQQPAHIRVTSEGELESELFRASADDVIISLAYGHNFTLDAPLLAKANSNIKVICEGSDTILELSEGNNYLHLGDNSKLTVLNCTMSMLPVEPVLPSNPQRLEPSDWGSSAILRIEDSTVVLQCEAIEESELEDIQQAIQESGGSNSMQYGNVTSRSAVVSHLSLEPFARIDPGRSRRLVLENCTWVCRDNPEINSAGQVSTEKELWFALLAAAERQMSWQNQYGHQSGSHAGLQTEVIEIAGVVSLQSNNWTNAALAVMHPTALYGSSTGIEGKQRVQLTGLDLRRKLGVLEVSENKGASATDAGLQILHTTLVNLPIGPLYRDGDLNLQALSSLLWFWDPVLGNRDDTVLVYVSNSTSLVECAEVDIWHEFIDTMHKSVSGSEPTSRFSAGPLEVHVDEWDPKGLHFHRLKAPGMLFEDYVVTCSEWSGSMLIPLKSGRVWSDDASSLLPMLARSAKVVGNSELAPDVTVDDPAVGLPGASLNHIVVWVVCVGIMVVCLSGAGVVAMYLRRALRRKRIWDPPVRRIHGQYTHQIDDELARALKPSHILSSSAQGVTATTISDGATGSLCHVPLRAPLSGGGSSTTSTTPPAVGIQSESTSTSGFWSSHGAGLGSNWRGMRETGGAMRFSLGGTGSLGGGGTAPMKLGGEGTRAGQAAGGSGHNEAHAALENRASGEGVRAQPESVNRVWWTEVPVGDGLLRVFSSPIYSRRAADEGNHIPFGEGEGAKQAAGADVGSQHAGGGSPARQSVPSIPVTLHRCSAQSGSAQASQMSRHSAESDVGQSDVQSWLDQTRGQAPESAAKRSLKGRGDKPSSHGPPPHPPSGFPSLHGDDRLPMIESDLDEGDVHVSLHDIIADSYFDQAKGMSTAQQAELAAVGSRIAQPPRGMEPGAVHVHTDRARGFSDDQTNQLVSPASPSYIPRSPSHTPQSPCHIPQSAAHAARLARSSHQDSGEPGEVFGAHCSFSSSHIPHKPTGSSPALSPTHAQHSPAAAHSPRSPSWIPSAPAQRHHSSHDTHPSHGAFSSRARPSAAADGGSGLSPDMLSPRRSAASLSGAQMSQARGPRSPSRAAHSPHRSGAAALSDIPHSPRHQPPASPLLSPRRGPSASQHASSSQAPAPAVDAKLTSPHPPPELTPSRQHNRSPPYFLPLTPVLFQRTPQNIGGEQTVSTQSSASLGTSASYGYHQPPTETIDSMMRSEQQAAKEQERRTSCSTEAGVPARTTWQRSTPLESKQQLVSSARPQRGPVAAEGPVTSVMFPSPEEQRCTPRDTYQTLNRWSQGRSYRQVTALDTDRSGHWVSQSGHRTPRGEDDVNLPTWKVLSGKGTQER